ncbi:MAG: hypothetical protein A2Z20_01495 [Bdellovibrionales bacterium RBG_16_40_8]|nr:MAG: hypothetical protein A2Z20_01495 [Bdellovibrionales bacterium RBG_16_40_8]
MYRKFSFLIILTFILAILWRQKTLQLNFLSKSQAESIEVKSSHKISNHLNTLNLSSSPRYTLEQSAVQIEPTTSSPNLKTMSDRDVYCLIEKTTPYIPLGGEVKIVHGEYNEYPNGLGVYAWIYSSQCPTETYSIVRIDSKNKVETAIDCKNTSFEELVAESGLQWNVDEVMGLAGQYNFAISGPGQFLVYCPNLGFHLSREGQFHFSNGLLEDSHGCFLWQNGDNINPQGGPITLENDSDELNNEGCFKNSGQCVAILDFKDQLVKQFQYVGPDLFSVEIDGDLKQTTRSRIFSNALERLDDPERGSTGIQKWESIENMKFPINCGNI